MPIEVRAGSTALRFSGAAELSAALLASLQEGRGYGDPVVRVGWDDGEPAWTWLGGLLATRSDWSPVVGRALQHAVDGGDDVVRGAFVDAMASVRPMVALLPWTAPLCATLGPIEGRHGKLPWNESPSRPRLDLVLQAQQKWLEEQRAPEARIALEGWSGPAASFFPLRDAADLHAALGRAARRGRFVPGEWGDGPAAWLHLAVLVQPWVDEALVKWVAQAVDGSDGERLLAMEWLLDERDLWRYIGLIEALLAKPRPWMSFVCSRKASGWSRPLRVPADGPATLGLLLAKLLTRAREQAGSPPIDDLPRRA